MSAELKLDFINGRPATKEEVLELLNREIDRFSMFMSTLGDWKSVGPLSPSERALVLTYLVQKVNGKLDKEESNG